jgi:hypothetical protein
MTTIEFTDRYGGNPPAWIRSCHECEAMGGYFETCNENLWCQRPSDHNNLTFDGWHVLRCSACNGTGRVPWYVSVARIPRWIVKGLRFFDQMARPRYRASHMTQGQHIWLVFKCAFVYDLMRLRR